MQLSMRDLTRLLDVEETTISRWIKHRRLPAHQVGGQYRVNRADLLEWATANGVRVSLELFDNLESDDEPAPNLESALQAGGIHYGLQHNSKGEAIKALIQALPLPDGTDRELLLRIFLAREAAATTAIGNGIAIPHVRNPIVLQVEQPVVTLCFLAAPVDFGALDGKPVRVLFSLICPTMRSHLQMLARLSYALHDTKFKAVLMRQGKPEEILSELRRIEAGLVAQESEGRKEAR